MFCTAVYGRKAMESIPVMTGWFYLIFILLSFYVILFYIGAPEYFQTPLFSPISFQPKGWCREIHLWVSYTSDKQVYIRIEKPQTPFHSKGKYQCQPFFPLFYVTCDILSLGFPWRLDKKLFFLGGEVLWAALFVKEILSAVWCVEIGRFRKGGYGIYSCDDGKSFPTGRRNG